MRLSLPIFLTLLAASILAGCYPKGPENYTDFDLVYTNYSDSFDFAQLKTFALPDSIIKITGDAVTTPGTPPSMMSPTYANPILDQIRKNMIAYGYTEVNKNAHPDAIVLVSSTTTTNLFYYYDWGYWGWWYPGYYPGWGGGWYYPGYYPPYVSSYQTGSLFIQMVDQAVVTPATANVPVVWSCIINGLVEGGNATVLTRVQTSVDQAFSQSPYLKH